MRWSELAAKRVAEGSRTGTVQRAGLSNTGSFLMYEELTLQEC